MSCNRDSIHGEKNKKHTDSRHVGFHFIWLCGGFQVIFGRAFALNLIHKTNTNIIVFVGVGAILAAVALCFVLFLRSCYPSYCFIFVHYAFCSLFSSLNLYWPIIQSLRVSCITALCLDLNPFNLP